MSSDDLIDPSEIEKLLEEAGAAGPPPGAPTAREPSAGTPESTAPEATTPPTSAETDEVAQDPSPAGTGVLAADEIEALLQRAADSPDQLADSAAAGIAAAMSNDVGAASPNAQPFVFEEFGSPKGPQAAVQDITGLQDVDLDLRIELGRTEMLIEDVLKLKSGSVVELDKLAGDPVDILVNGRLVARGEVLVLNDNFCIRVAEILSPES